MIACDGGANYLRELGIKPSLVMGDFDSAAGGILDWCQKEHVPVHTAPKEKDDTDTMLAARWAIGQGAQHIKVVGATGGRLDHFYANLLLLNFCLNHGVECQLLDDQNRIFAAQEGEVCLHKDGYTYLSLFPFQGNPVVFAQGGVKYPLQHLALHYDDPVGVSNELLEQEVKLEIQGGRVLIIQSAGDGPNEYRKQG